MSKPRTLKVALETKEYEAWKNSPEVIKEIFPAHIKAHEVILMIEHSAYEELERKLDNALQEIESLKLGYRGFS